VYCTLTFCTSDSPITGSQTEAGEGKMRQIECTPQGEIPFGTLSLQGDQALAGFEELAMPLSHSLYNFARWLAHNQHDAEDLVQETYLEALCSFASFEPSSNSRHGCSKS
jgi:Sigma-70 region 2